MLKQVTADGMLRSINDNFGLLDTVSGRVYFVDGNAGSDTNSGSSWDDAFKTLAVALATSHANIAASSKGWAARNRIYCKGDSFEEDLTKLAQKTDVIGTGSCDHLHGARLIGNHAIDTTMYMGCRFINFHFKAPETGGDIFTIPTEQSGIAFIGCSFDGGSEVAAGGAIIATAVESLTIRGCEFRGAFSDAVIEIGAGESNSLHIEDNIVQGAEVGIEVSASATCTIRAGYILRNVINTTKECIKDSSGKFYVHGNYCVTGNAKGVAGAGGIVAGAKMMLQNYLSASDVANAIVPANGALS